MNPRVFVMMVLEQLAVPLNVVWPLNGPVFFVAFQANSSCVYSVEIESGLTSRFEAVSGDVFASQSSYGVALGA